MPDIFYTVFILEVPIIIITVSSFFVGYTLSKKLYQKTGHFWFSYTIGVSIFILLSLIVKVLTASSLSSLLGDKAIVLGMMFLLTNQYTFWIEILIKFVFVYILFSRLKKVPTQSWSRPSIFWFFIAVSLLILAVISISLPLVRQYQNRQIASIYDDQMTIVRSEVRDEVGKQAAEIISALDKYFTNKKKYPANLDRLIPEYLTSMPVAPRLYPYEYVSNSTFSDYRLCTFTDDGKRCFTAKGGWSSVRPYCNEGEEKQAGKMCQYQLDPESITF